MASSNIREQFIGEEFFVKPLCRLFWLCLSDRFLRTASRILIITDRIVMPLIVMCYIPVISLNCNISDSAKFRGSCISFSLCWNLDCFHPKWTPLEMESRQFPDTVFGGSSPTDLKTVPRHFLKTFPRHNCSVKWPVTDNYNFITSNYGFTDVFEDSSLTDVLHCIYTPNTKA